MQILLINKYLTLHAYLRPISNILNMILKIDRENRLKVGGCLFIVSSPKSSQINRAKSNG